MPRDLLAESGPRDLLEGMGPPPAQDGGVLADVGDWIVDNMGGVSATMRENARGGDFQRDAATDEGFLDRAGSLIERGAASFDQGIYSLLGGLGSEKARQAAADLGRTTGQDVAGNTTWNDATGPVGMGKYIVDAGLESIPGMAALAVPGAGWALTGASQTGNIAADRAANDGRDVVTREDIGDAFLPAAASTALDRFGLRGLLSPVGSTVRSRIGRAAAREGLTETAQGGMEYAGGTAGTEAGFDTAEALDQMLAAGTAGTGLGAGFRGGAEAANPILNNIRVRTRRDEPVAGQREEADDNWDGSLDDLLQADQPPRDLLALPSPEMVQRAGAEPEAAPAAKPGPVDDGGAVIRSIFGDDARITSTYRGPDHPLSQANPRSYHTRTRAAVDIAPIEGMTFEQAKAAIEAKGFNLIEAINETGKGKTAHATGDHWHFVIGQGGDAAPVDADIPAVDVPGADGSLLGRGERQERIARLDPPETSGQDWRLPQNDADPDGGELPVPAGDEGEGANQGGTVPQRAPLAPLPAAAPARVGAVSQVTTARGEPVDTQFELRDLSDLTDSSSPNYDRLLQPRDRASRATSDAQVASIAANLDPGQLADSRLASTGAPIIGPDGQVESGNGRVAAIARAYATNPDKAEAYRQMIAAQGLDATGMERPVLVRRRTTEMTPEQRQAWTRAANERDTMAMSSTEQASADARALPDATLALYRGGPVTAAANRDFVRAFIDRAVSPAERNAMTASDGSISADGVRRIRFALLARAYGDTELISRISEDTDTNIAAIGKALLDAAPAMARLRAKVEAGEIPAQYDISNSIAEAARMVARSRETGQSLSGMLAQTDAFAAETSPVTEQVLYIFFRDAELKRPRSGQKVADALIDYAGQAEAIAEQNRQGPDIFGNDPDIPSPATLLQRARGKLDGDTEGQRDLLAPQGKTATTSPDDATDRPGQAAPATSRSDGNQSDARSGGAVPTLARGQLRALGIAAELRTEKAAALVGRTASNPRELAEIAQVYRDPRFETFRVFYTKGNTIVHATGVSSRSIAEAPLMPDDMNSAEFYASVKQTMEASGADGYYLLHNHPSGVPDPSPSDKAVTRQFASNVPGFRAHVVINSNKYARIELDSAGRTRSNISNLDMGAEKLIAASLPHDVLGRTVNSATALAETGKELQKPGWVTVIGTDAKGHIRVVLDYPASAAKREARSLMAMGRRIQQQSGSASLFLVGDQEALSSPAVTRALSAGIVTAAIGEDGQPVSAKVARKSQMPKRPGRYVAEEVADFPRGARPNDPGPGIADKLVDKDGITRDIEAIRNAVGKPIETLKGVVNGGFAQMGRAYFYTMDARLRGLAKRYDSEAINQLADMFHARAGVVDKAVDETYHEAVDREGFGRAGQMWRALEKFAGDKAAMERIGMMLRNPGARQRGRRAEAEAAAKVAKLLKDTIDYRKAAGEDIGEVSDGYFPRMLDVEKVVKNRDLFLRQATELYKRHGADNPKASAEAWLARTFDQYAGLDGGLDFIDLFHDTRPAGVGRKTAKSREFGKDADALLGQFYDNDTGQVLTGYFIGAARKSEEARRFGVGSDGQAPLRKIMSRIKSDIRKSGEDAGDAIDEIARMVATNLGRVKTPPEAIRTTASILHTAGQLGTLDRATITSLSEAMMGFVRAGPKYGTQMVIDSAKEFANQLRGAPPSEAARMAEALGIAHDAMIGEALSARAGFERGHTNRRAQKVQQGFFRATGLHQWTEGTRTAATRMGGKFLRDLAFDMEGRNPARAAEYLRELGVKDPKAFSAWLRKGGAPSPESLLGQHASPMEQQYRGALLRFVNQTIMKPSRAEKPRWASSPTGALFFSLLSFSYGFKKNVLDRTGLMAMRAAKEGDPTLLYPAFGLAGLFAAHTVINNVLRQAIFGGGREDDEEGVSLIDWMEALDRAGLFGAASPLLNAIWGLKYRRGTMESMVGPVAGRPFDLLDKTVALATSGNSPNTNSAERAAAGALYDIVLEPALEAYGVTRLKGPLAAGVVWGSGNREGGIVPPDRDMFVDAVAGPKAD